MMPLTGKCNITYIVMRAEPSGKSEMVSQVIFGETYTVLKEEDDWYFIKNNFDGYTGWISAAQHNPMEVGNLYTGVFSEVSGKQGDFWVPCGAEIENGRLTTSVDLIKLAHDFLFTPYLWGGRTFMGIDCSGLIQVMFKTRNIALPRDARDQVNAGNPVQFGDRKALDVAFFANDSGKVTHTGLIIHPDEIIHAHGWVRKDRLDIKGIYNVAKDKYSHQLHSIRRFF